MYCNQLDDFLRYQKKYIKRNNFESVELNKTINLNLH